MPVETRFARSMQSADSARFEVAYVRSRRRDEQSTPHAASSSSADVTVSEKRSHVTNHSVDPSASATDLHIAEQAGAWSSPQFVDRCRRAFCWLSSFLPCRRAVARRSDGRQDALISDSQFFSRFHVWPHAYVLSKDCVKVITEEIINENYSGVPWSGSSSCLSRSRLVYTIPLLLFGSCLLLGMCYPEQRAKLNNGALQYMRYLGLSIGHKCETLLPSIVVDSDRRDDSGWSGNFFDEKWSEKLKHLELQISHMHDKLEQTLEQVQRSPCADCSQYRVDADTVNDQLNQIRDDVMSLKEEMSTTVETIEKHDAILQNQSRQFSLLPALPCEWPKLPAPQSRDGPLDHDDVDERIREALKKYDADKTGMADYALESAGSTLLSIRCTETYPHKTRVITLLGVPLFYKTYSPRKVIQPGTMPGECWAFTGSVGSVVIKLSGTIQVSGVSYEHAARSVLPDDHMESAPKRFDVYGLMSKNDNDPVLLGEYTYEDNGEPLQYFPVQATNATAVPIVEFKILRNHGHPEYTCLYRFRVHGRRVSPVYGEDAEA